MAKVEVLISAMHQKDLSIIDRSRICSDVLLINQCDRNGAQEETREYGKVRCLSTTERGLSRSRNMALKNAVGTYCLFCDDDEVLYDGYEKEIEAAYERYPNADLICFQIKRPGKSYPSKFQKINYIRSLKISSCQISMRLDSVIDAGISFDPSFGSGTPLGSGEENIFMFDCLRRRLKIFYVPVCLGEVAQKNSMWFKGFDEQYFLNRGTIIKRLMGSWFGFLYCLYFAASKYPRYKNKLTIGKALNLMLQGMRVKLK